MSDKNWSLFNCLQPQEHNDIAKHYHLEQQTEVKAFLKENCINGRITNSTHQEVHELILNQLGFIKA